MKVNVSELTVSNIEHETSFLPGFETGNKFQSP